MDDEVDTVISVIELMFFYGNDSKYRLVSVLAQRNSVIYSTRFAAKLQLCIAIKRMEDSCNYNQCSRTGTTNSCCCQLVVFILNQLQEEKNKDHLGRKFFNPQDYYHIFYSCQEKDSSSEKNQIEEWSFADHVPSITYSSLHSLALTNESTH